MFKQGTWFKIKDGIHSMCNNGRYTIAIRDFAKNCKVSDNTIYKFWDIAREKDKGVTVYVNGAFYDVFAHVFDGVKCFTVWAKGV